MKAENKGGNNLTGNNHNDHFDGEIIDKDYSLEMGYKNIKI